MSAGKSPAKHGGAFSEYLESVRYAKHVIFRPFDGFWDLVHESRGSLAAAHTFLFLFLLCLLGRRFICRLLRLTFLFQFLPC